MTGPPETPSQSVEAVPPNLGYWALFARFLRFGVMAFGGPVAQIAMIRRELVDEERWIGSASFNRLLAVMQVLPGPEAHELCVHLGVRAKGRIGGLLAGLGFMLPGFFLMIILASLYSAIRIDTTIFGAAFLGVQAAVLAVILLAVHRIGKHILLSAGLWLTALLSAIAAYLDVVFWIILPAAGAAYALGHLRRRGAALLVSVLAVLVAMLLPDLGFQPEPERGVLKASDPSVVGLFLAGLKGGLLTFGGAYTAIPFVRNDTVSRGWMTDAQFLDGVALAGVIPAPLVIFVTFVGWVIDGAAGALAITAGMFLPAFAFSLLFYDRLEEVAEHKSLQAFFAGVAAGVIGLIVVTFLDLSGASAERSPNLTVSLGIFLSSAAVLLVWKNRFNTPVVLASGGAIGLFVLG